MGQEKEERSRAQIFPPYQVNEELMAGAASHAVFMHCLPAHRGEEVTDGVIDSVHSVVFDQAESGLDLVARRREKPYPGKECSCLRKWFLRIREASIPPSLFRG